jgi:O-antigen biosynthesis protein
MPTGVVVTGMDRSGTSATTRLIALLGLHPPVEADLIQARGTNPTGVWESKSLASLNIRLLKAVGSDERFPLALGPGWERDARLDQFRAEARDAFTRSFPAAPWVWKDPLHCLSFSFWRDTLAGPLLVVLMTRNPLEIAASAARAWGREKIYGLALWERYLRQALWQLAGLPVLVTSYADVLEDPVAWARRAHAALGGAGVAVSSYSDDDVRAAVDRSLRHTSFSREDVESDGDVSRAQRALFDVLTELDGMHTCFVTPALPDETPTTDALLSERRRTFEIKDRLEGLLAEERQARWSSRLRRSRYVAGMRPVYLAGRKAVRALAQKLGGR